MKGTVSYHGDALPYDVSVAAAPRRVCLFNAHVHNKKKRHRWINSRIYISATPYEKRVCVRAAKTIFVAEPFMFVGDGGWRIQRPVIIMH